LVVSKLRRARSDDGGVSARVIGGAVRWACEKDSGRVCGLDEWVGGGGERREGEGRGRDKAGKASRLGLRRLLDVADDLPVDDCEPALVFLFHFAERLSDLFEVRVCCEAAVEGTFPVIAFRRPIGPEAAPLCAELVHLQPDSTSTVVSTQVLSSGVENTHAPMLASMSLRGIPACMATAWRLLPMLG
jgi:hypothetical protein